MAASSATKDLLLGKVVQINKIGLTQIPCALVRCQENVFSSYIKKYFANSTDFWALDNQKKSNIGDHVLIRRVEKSERPTSSVMYNVERVVFEFGKLVDPITKKRENVSEFDIFTDEVDDLTQHHFSDFENLKSESISRNHPAQEAEDMDGGKRL